jgi:CRP/FNR family transcriptional regulator, cyclic AMP receptor protein
LAIWLLAAALLRHGMTEQEGLNFLLSHGWLAHQPADLRQALAGILRWRRFDPDESVYQSDELGGGMIGIASGQLGVTSAIAAVDSPLAHVLLPGDWEGPAPLFGVNRVASCTAMTPALVAVLPYVLIRQLLAGNPAWWEQMARFTFDVLIRYGGAFGDMLIRDSDRRCLAVLLRLGGCRFAGDAPVSVAISQGDLAAAANLSRHIAGDALRQQELQGRVHVGYRKIEILEPAALRHYVVGD